MQIDADRLKSVLRQRLTDRSRYNLERFTLLTVMARAADIAAAVVDELASKPQPGSAPLGSGRDTASGRVDDPRKAVANEKRAAILAALARGPLKASVVGRMAHLTPGELAYLLKTTPGVERIGAGLYRLAPHG